jgi:hypothetical protein
MCVSTRFQKNSALYSHVLENPLILQNIFHQLDAKDALHLSITNAPFTKEVRFIDTLNLFIEEKKIQYEEDMKIKKCTKFCSDAYIYLKKFYAIQDLGGSMDELILQMKVVYDHVNENKWFLETNLKFKNMVETMLLKHLNCEHFQHHSLFYLGEIFGIFVKAEVSSDDDDDDDDIVEYVMSTYGEKMYLFQHL